MARPRPGCSWCARLDRPPVRPSRPPRPPPARLWVMPSLCAAAARFAVSAVSTVATRWRGGYGGDGVAFDPGLLGTHEMFWQFLRLANAIELVSA